LTDTPGSPLPGAKPLEINGLELARSLLSASAATASSQEAAMRRTTTDSESGLPHFPSTEKGTKLAALLLLVAAVLFLVMVANASPQPIPAKKAAQIKRPERRIVVSIPDRKLALLEHGRVVKIYSVAVGASDTPTPSGIFQITTRLTNPTWYWPHLVVPPGPDNPLGTRWMGLGPRGFGIHGTNAPASIGRAASHGCIRMRRRDLEEVFAKMRVGDVVELRGAPSVELARIFIGETKTSVAGGDAQQSTTHIAGQVEARVIAQVAPSAGGTRD
jgi:lipoprotein-anchoring transpeptidase ErfK/SrfK